MTGNKSYLLLPVQNGLEQRVNDTLQFLALVRRLDGMVVRGPIGVDEQGAQRVSVQQPVHGKQVEAKVGNLKTIKINRS